MLTNSRFEYGSMAKVFHWGMALIMIMLFAGMYYAEELPRSELKSTIYMFHKSTGILMFAFVVLRLTWRLTQEEPELPKDMNVLQLFFARLNIILLYGLMFGMPISGYLMAAFGKHPVTLYGLLQLPSFEHSRDLSHFFHNLHIIQANVVFWLFWLHVAAALYHHFVRKDDTLSRMLPSS